jgi:hypothetical protein
VYPVKERYFHPERKCKAVVLKTPEILEDLLKSNPQILPQDPCKVTIHEVFLYIVYHCFYTTIYSVYYKFEFLEGSIGGVYIDTITLYIVPVNGYTP